MKKDNGTIQANDWASLLLSLVILTAFLLSLLYHNIISELKPISNSSQIEAPALMDPDVHEI